MHHDEKREIRARRGLTSRHPEVDDWEVVGEGVVHPAKQLRAEGNETRVQLLRGMAEGPDLVIRRPTTHSFAWLGGTREGFQSRDSEWLTGSRDGCRDLVKDAGISGWMPGSLDGFWDVEMNLEMDLGIQR